MCGIAGALGTLDGVDLPAMLSCLRRRGPDDHGRFTGRRVALGFRRLSIVDVQHGGQPLFNERRDCVLVCNGEIYNHRSLREDLLERGHRFSTYSDAEVIVHLYEEHGPACLDRLRGMFAFALWDERRERLLVARDHVGMKPLYYAWRHGRLIFASQLAALLASGCVEKRLDVRSIQRMLIYQGIPPPETAIEGCRMLPAGHYLEMSPGQAPEPHAYWQFRYRPPRHRLHPDDAARELRARVEATVRTHLQSEVPLGSFLSGGLDSSAVVACLVAQRPGPLRTFSVGFTGPGTDGYSELPYARMVADHFGTEHHEAIHDGTSVARALPSMIEAMDQPTTDGVNTFLVSALAARDVTVAFSGTGPDELLLGYTRDAWIHRFRHHHAANRLVPARLLERARRLLARLPDDLLTPSVRQWQRHLDDRHASLRSFLFSQGSGYSILTPESCRRLMRRSAWRDGMWDDYVDPFARVVPSDREPLLVTLARWETLGFAGYVLLPDIDAMSMFHSLEVRVPFYDRDLAEWLFSLPAELKHPRYGTKWLLKRAFERDLPPAILHRLKQGFSLPLHAWLGRELAVQLDTVLDDEAVRRRGLFEPVEVARLRANLARGDTSGWRALWAMMVIESWCRLRLDGRMREEIFEPGAEVVAACA